jgi:hypothetical protein
MSWLGPVQNSSSPVGGMHLAMSPAMIWAKQSTVIHIHTYTPVADARIPGICTAAGRQTRLLLLCRAQFGS